jgi:iron complex transport system substrate-binding protein
MRLRIVLAIGILLCVLAVARAESSFVITDALGRAVVVPQSPKRIISLAPSVTEILFALGLDDQVIGVSDADDYPPDRVTGKPRVGGVQVNVEMVVGLRPDLVLGLPSLQRTVLDRLIGLRLPVVAVDARSLPEIYTQIDLLGRVSGHAEVARRLVSEMQSRERTIMASVHGRQSPRVYVEIWGEPLAGVGGGTFLDDLIWRAGGTNILSDLRGWPQVAAETVIARNPEIIVLTHPGRTIVLHRRGWSSIAAIRSGRVTEIESSIVSKPGPRIVLGLEQLARILHPEAQP